MVSVLSIIAIIYVTILLIVEFPGYYRKYSAGDVHPIVYGHFDDTILDTLAMSFFAYTCHTSLFPVYSDLAYPSKERMSKVVVRTIMACCGFYLLISIIGYLSTFDDTPPLVVNRDPLTGDRDVWMMAARLGIYISVMVGFPVNFNPYRNSLYHFLTGSTDFSFKANLLITTVTLMITTTVAIVYPNIIAVLSILGGFGSVFICFFIPVTLRIKLSEHRFYHWSNMIYLIPYGILCLIGWASGTRVIVLSIMGEEDI